MKTSHRKADLEGSPNANHASGRESKEELGGSARAGPNRPPFQELLLESHEL